MLKIYYQHSLGHTRKLQLPHPPKILNPARRYYTNPTLSLLVFAITDFSLTGYILRFRSSNTFRIIKHYFQVNTFFILISTRCNIFCGVTTLMAKIDEVKSSSLSQLSNRRFLYAEWTKCLLLIIINCVLF